MNRSNSSFRRMLGNPSTRQDGASLPLYISSGSHLHSSRVARNSGRPLNQERLLSGASIPPQSRPQLQTVVLDDDIGRELNPRLRQLMLEPPPPVLPIQLDFSQFFPEELTDYSRFFMEHEQSKLTQDEQNKVLKKLKKEIYNPPRRIVLRLYYREIPSNEKEKEDEDLKRCAICLEDFKAREEVLLTPCNHMFHEDCIVPWVKSHGKCPVCRFAIC